MSGSTKKDSFDLLNDLAVPEFEEMSRREIANAINSALLEPLQTFESFDLSTVYLALEDDVEFLEVSTYRVYNSLLHLNKYKASGPDGLPNWLLKDFAELLVDPVTDILNASFREQKLPNAWKLADISPLPKVKQVSDPKKELRPISLTSSLSKIAQDFVVTDYIKPAVVKSIDPKQFGTITGSSTVMALKSMLHKWLGDTDSRGSTIRVLLCDYRKAFDLIDHSLLVTKLKQLYIPRSIINWVVSFLTCRSQRVKLGQDCFSEWGVVPSTVSETISKGEQSNMQLAANQVQDWSKENLFQLNCDKTKELVINYSRSNQEEFFPSVYIEGN